MATSWFSETDEKVNYTKLCRLLYDGGTLAVRNTFNGIIPPTSLHTVLASHRTSLQRLKKPIGRVLSQGQWNLLFPPSGSPKAEDFDITLLFVLLRNICGLTPPPSGWDDLPPPTDTSCEANLVRVKYYRNQVVAHRSKAEVDSTQFETYWSDISDALVALGLMKDDIDELKKSPLGEKKYNQLVEDWYVSDQEIKSQLETVKSHTSQIKTDASQIKTDASQIKIDASQIKTDASHIKKDTSEIKASTSRMESDIKEIKERVTHKHNTLDCLALRDFNSTINKLCDKCHPNTREWLISDVKSRVSQDHSNAGIEVIQAGPGMGKSVVAAKLCQEYKRQGILGGCHFFKHDNSLLNNPRLMLQSVARQLCKVLPKYRDILERSLSCDLGISQLTCKELWTLLFEEPCTNGKIKPDCYFVIIIDALDECCNSLKKELFAILEQTSNLPSWLQFVLTTRPPPSISSFESISSPIIIDTEGSNNTDDLQMYMTDRLRELGHTLSNKDEYQILKLVGMTKGLFLVAYFFVDYLKKSNTTSITEAVEQFPKGITSFYEDYFSRLYKVMLPHIHSEEGFYDMLEAVVTAESPIEKVMFYSILGLKKEPRAPNRERKEAMNLLHQLFPIENDHVSAFHKTVIDWLRTGDHDFSVKEDCVCSVLANKCYEVVLTLKQNQKQFTTLEQPPILTDCEIYALKYLFRYIDKSKDFSIEKKVEMERDGYILCLQGCYNCYHSRHIDICVDISEFFRLKNCSPSVYPSFAHVLDYVYQALHLRKGGNQGTLDYLNENDVPYIERKKVLADITNKNNLWITQILACNSGVLVVEQSKQETEATTKVQMFQLDGSLVQEMSFAGLRRFYMSPDNQVLVSTGYFIDVPSLKIIAKYHSRLGWTGYSRDIEFIDVPSLKIIAKYQSPESVRECYVFGCQPWYIALQCFNNMLYIMDVKTGALIGQPTALNRYDILAVSKKEHVFIVSPSPIVEDGCREIGIFRELLSLSDENIPVCARVYQDCEQCKSRKEELYNTHACFSDDAELLAIYYNGVLTIVHTSDGSCYKNVHLCGYGGQVEQIVHLSKKRIIIVLGLTSGSYCMLLIKFVENEDVALEHILYLSNANANIVKICKFFKSDDDNIKSLITHNEFIPLNTSPSRHEVFFYSISLPV